MRKRIAAECGKPSVLVEMLQLRQQRWSSADIGKKFSKGKSWAASVATGMTRIAAGDVEGFSDAQVQFSQAWIRAWRNGRIARNPVIADEVAEVSRKVVEQMEKGMDAGKVQEAVNKLKQREKT